MSADTKLSRKDLEEITGLKEFDNLEDLEILFNNFTEISSLVGFPRLRRLACIDNGIKRISNLEPISLTLQILNLSDQDISKIENLNLPNLRELYLHRNYIRAVGSSSLSGCPRLKKLWLCQNQITNIDGLHGVPELEELWLQSNNITSLEGLACCPALVHLGMAGNNVSDFLEVRRLTALKMLTSLSFQDIHFGRCPVTDEDGYKDFVSCHLPWVQVLDGVEISQEQVDDAHLNYVKEVNSFNEMMTSIENNHVKNLQTIAHKQQSRTSHSSVLEKEMVTALSELEGFVAEGRKNISRHMNRQNEVLHRNMKELKQNVDVIYKDTKKSVDRSMSIIKEEYDLTESIFFTLDKVYGTIANVTDVLAATRDECQNGYKYHPISDNTPDFQHVSAILGGVGSDPDEAMELRGIKPLNLMKLFKTHLEIPLEGGGSDDIKQQSRGGSRLPLQQSGPDTIIQAGASSRRVYTVCPLSQIGEIIKNNWSYIEDTLVFCSNPSVAAALFLSASTVSRPHGLHLDVANGSDELLIPISEMPAFESAQQLNTVVLLSCDLDVISTALISYIEEAAAPGKEPQMIRLPVNANARGDLLSELQRSKKLVGVQLEHDLGWIYTVPPSRRQGGRARENTVEVDNAEVIRLEYICICTDRLAGVEGGLKLLEQRLEVLLSPPAGCALGIRRGDEVDGNGVGNVQNHIHSPLNSKSGAISNNDVLETYEARLQEQVARYMDHALEELNSEQADVLRDVDDKVLRKEDQLQALKAELVRERKMQENLLRDMKVFDTSNDSKSKGKGRASKFN